MIDVRTFAIRLAALALMVAGATTRAGEPAYPHAAVESRQIGDGPRSYWLFEPAGPRPGGKAPVVVFLHGWLAVDPAAYGAWIEHLARSGNLVIAPRYQEDWRTPPDQFLPNAAAAVRDGLDVLETGEGRVRPDRGRVAMVGHSAGGNLAALLAAGAVELGIPSTRAVVAVTPGEVRPQTSPRLADVPASTVMVVVAAEDDWIVNDARARAIFAGATAVPDSHKEFVLYRTDRHGRPPLVADHLMPTGRPGRADALDRDGIWRLTDLAIAAGFGDGDLDAATDRGALLRDLGNWPDGTPIRPAISGDDLAAIPRVAPARRRRQAAAVAPEGPVNPGPAPAPAPR